MPPPISIIIPILKEPTIDVFLADLFKRFSGESFEVIVVDGDAEGGSIGRLHRFQAALLASRAGRGPQMNAGARAARGEILLFLHADTHLPDKAFDRIRETMTGSRYAAGAFTLRFAGRSKALSLIARAATLRCRLSRIPYGDQAIFMRRRDFVRLGGYGEFAIMEDVDLMRRIRKRGGRVCLLSEAVLTSPRRWEKEGVIFSLFRTWLLSTLFLCGVPPKRLLKLYRPHAP